MDKDEKFNSIVSVIIPVYNVCMYVHEAINSVIHQTYPYLEIIIIDDGSTDGSSNICDEFAELDNRIIVVHTDNQGLSAARNMGLSIMTGDVVAFLDSDDAFVPDAIEKALYFMHKEDTDIVSFGFSSFRTDGPLKAMKNKDRKGRCFVPPAGKFSSFEGLRMLLQVKSIWIAVWCMIYKASLWKDLSFPEGLTYEDNYVLPIIMKRARSVGSLSQILLLNRRRKGSITQTFTSKNMRDQLQGHRFLTAFVLENTPAIFSRSLSTEMQENEINLCIRQYSISRESTYRKELRKNILDNNSKVKAYKRTTRIKMYCMWYTPRLFSLLYYYFVVRPNIKS